MRSGSDQKIRPRARAQQSRASAPAGEEKGMTRAARHAPCDRHSVFSAVAQTLRDATGLLPAVKPRKSPLLLLDPGTHRGASPRAAGPDPSSKPLLPRLPFSPSPASSSRQRELQSSCKVLWRPGRRYPRDSAGSRSALRRSASLLGRQTRRTSPEWSRRRGPARVGSPPDSQRSRQVVQVPPVHGGGWRNRGCGVSAAAASAAASPAAAAAARASRAGYINTRFHTPELTSAGPAQPGAGGGPERRTDGRDVGLGGEGVGGTVDGGSVDQSPAPNPTWGSDVVPPRSL
ncbi:uncharacterized protein RHO17_006185 [Thomomys bottae]